MGIYQSTALFCGRSIKSAPNMGIRFFTSISIPPSPLFLLYHKHSILLRLSHSHPHTVLSATVQTQCLPFVHGESPQLAKPSHRPLNWVTTQIPSPIHLSVKDVAERTGPETVMAVLLVGEPRGFHVALDRSAFCLQCSYPPISLRHRLCPNPCKPGGGPPGPCQACDRLKIECLGYTYKRPYWLRVRTDSILHSAEC